MAGPYNPEYSYSKITYEYSYGMISKEYYWDDADNLVYITVYESSDYSTKNFESTYFTDPDGNLILSPDYGVARIEITCDESGRITKFVCYDEKGNIIDSDVIGRSFEVTYDEEGNTDISYLVNYDGMTELEDGVFTLLSSENGLNMITFVDGGRNTLSGYPVIVYFRTRVEDGFALYVMYFTDYTMTDLYPVGDKGISSYTILKNGEIPEFSKFFDARGRLMTDERGNFIGSFSVDEDFEIIAFNDDLIPVMNNTYNIAGQIKEKGI